MSDVVNIPCVDVVRNFLRCNVFDWLLTKVKNKLNFGQLLPLLIVDSAKTPDQNI